MVSIKYFSLLMAFAWLKVMPAFLATSTNWIALPEAAAGSRLRLAESAAPDA